MMFRSSSRKKPADANNTVKLRARKENPHQDATFTRPVFTPREHDVLTLLCRGRTNQEIARALRITEATVKNHLASIYEKLGAGNRVEAVLAAQARGLCPLPPLPFPPV